MQLLGIKDGIASNGSLNISGGLGLFKPMGISSAFTVPLTSSGVPVKGDSSYTFSRSTAATVTDFEGVLHTANINELRFPGTRRVENLFRYSSNFSNSAWVKQSVTLVPNSAIAPDATLTAYKMTSIVGTSTGIYQIMSNYNLNVDHIFSIYAKADGKDTFRISWNGYGTTIFNLSTGEVSGPGGMESVGNGWYRCYTMASRTLSGQALTIRFLDTSGDGTSGFYLWNAQAEKVMGTQTEPSEYVSSGVLSWPYHGAGVDGVKYFMTDRSGNALSTDGALIEPSSTNLFLNSSAPVTQNITVVNGSSYTVWGTGSGSVVLSGAGSGTVTSSTPITFTATGTTLTCTVTNMSTVQAELGVKTSYIPTSGTAVTRTSDTLSYDVEDAITQGQGSLYFEFTYYGSFVAYPHIFSLDCGLSSDRIYVYISSSSNYLVLSVLQGGVQNGTISEIITIGESYKALVILNSDSASLYVNGVKVGTVSGTLPTNLTTLHVGCHYGESQNLNGEIKNMRYFKKVLSESEAIRRTI